MGIIHKASRWRALQTLRMLAIGNSTSSGICIKVYNNLTIERFFLAEKNGKRLTLQTPQMLAIGKSSSSRIHIKVYNDLKINRFFLG